MQRKVFFSLLTLVALCAVTLDATAAKSFKRGVSKSGSGIFLQSEYDIIAPGVSWYYNWGNTPNSGFEDIVNESDEVIEFIPMCWNASYNADAIREWCNNHPETKYLLGFNEPNFVAQANMTPAAAAAAWPEVKALADELGLELVGPAVNYSPDTDTYPEYEMYTWYSEFVDLVGLDAFDYIAIHCYSSGTSGMQLMVDSFYEAYGKPIWLTEFCMYGDGSATCTAEQQIASMIQQLEYLEKSDRVYRYAWFILNNSATTSPANGLIKPALGTDRELSEQGMVYVYMSDFDETVFHDINEIVPASEYISSISSSSLMLGSSDDSSDMGQLDITRFVYGAYADYQFDIPQAGEYTLTLRVSDDGYEQGRFNPAITIYSVNEDGEILSTLCEASTFELPTDGYANVSFSLTLTAGKQRIRIADGSPYQPSSIRISCLSFGEIYSSVQSVSATVAGDGKLTCSLSGGMLYVNGIDNAVKGDIYDLNGRKLSTSVIENGTMPVGDFAKGIYILKISTIDGKEKATKFTM